MADLDITVQMVKAIPFQYKLPLIAVYCKLTCLQTCTTLLGPHRINNMVLRHRPHPLFLEDIEKKLGNKKSPHPFLTV